MRNLTTDAFTRVGLLLIDTQWFGCKLLLTFITVFFNNFVPATVIQ